MAHGHDDVETAVKVALAAFEGVTHIGDRDQFVIYNDLILAALSEAARKALQMLPNSYQIQSPLIRESIEKGLAQGLVQGRTEEKALSVLEVFDARDIVVPEEVRKRILACTDLVQLSTWHKRAITVASVDELFTQ
jgi:hypothetical protein